MKFELKYVGAYFVLLKNILEGIEHAFNSDFFGLTNDIGFILLAWMIINIEEIQHYLNSKYNK